MSCYNSVCVKVERRSKLAGATPQRLFMQSFDVIDMMYVPYQQIIDVLRIMFGTDVVITFSSELITYKIKVNYENKMDFNYFEIAYPNCFGFHERNGK